RKAESRYVATLLRSTLETSGQWGAVRVAPESAQFIDVIVSGKIVESTGAKLALDITVKDSTGRVWINARRYQTPPDTGSYKTDAALKARDPFQNLHSAIDTVNGYYANFSDQMNASYGQWRRASFEEIEKEQRALNQARTRTYLGAAAVLASVFVPNQCSPYDYNCQRVQSAARYGGAIGGTAAFLSGLKKYADAKVHAQALKEMSETFQSEVAPQVIDVEGRTLKLTGTAE